MMKPLLHIGPQGLGMILGFPVFLLSQAQALDASASVFFQLGYFLQHPVFKSLDHWPCFGHFCSPTQNQISEISQ